MKQKLKPLNQQTIVITGASSGIGLVTARMAARKGAKVVAAARNEEALMMLVEEIHSHGGQAIAVVADVGNEADIGKIMMVANETFGGVDPWVNNAGVSIFGRIEDVPTHEMRRMFDTNYWGTVYGSKAAVAHFKSYQKAGAIINVGSFFGDRSTVIQSTYSTSKNPLHGFTDALRMELEKDKAHISVTLIHPGRIDTPYNDHAGNHMPQQPAHRGMLYSPDAVADAILFSAVHPKRDMYVGFQSKVLAVASMLSPRLMDKFLEAYGYRSQRSDRPAEGPPGRNALQPPIWTARAWNS
jgi:short-subunit dehydrogenase